MLTKISEGTGYKNVFYDLPDQPVLTAAQIKNKLDEASENIIDYINDTLTEEIDTALDGKEDTMPTLSINRALVSDSDGRLSASAVTSAELNYLQGVTSSIQSQLNGKQSSISLTADKVMITNSSGEPSASSVGASLIRAIRYGSGDPDNSIGTDGDIYLKIV